MELNELKSNTFVGFVEDNQDPKKLGRCRVRVMNVFEEIPKEDIPWAKPWKDLNGNQFTVPDVGKVVTVIFDGGNVYKPQYIYAEHYNINLEEKLKQLSGINFIQILPENLSVITSEILSIVMSSEIFIASFPKENFSPKIEIVIPQILS